MKIVIVIPPSEFLSDDRVFPYLGPVQIATALRDLGRHDVRVIDLTGHAQRCRPTVPARSGDGGNEGARGVLRGAVSEQRYEYHDAPECDAEVWHNAEAEISSVSRGGDVAVFGVYALSCQVHAAVKIRDLIRRYSPGSKTVLGGPHVAMAPEAAASLGFDHVVADLGGGGGGEAPTLMLMRRLVMGLPVAPVVRAELRQADLHRWPWPDRRMIDILSYDYRLKGERTATIVTQRGCPYACSFCSHTSFYRKIEYRDAAHVEAELRELRTRFGYRAVMLYDDETNISDAHYEALCRVLGRGEWIWRGFIKSNLFTPNQAATAARSGAVQLCTGGESMNAEIKKHIQKKSTVDDDTRFVRLCLENGIAPKMFCVAGSTRLFTSRGVVTVRDLHQPTALARVVSGINVCADRVQIATHSGNARVAAAISTGRKQTIRVRLRSGLSLDVTADHRLLRVENNDLPALERARETSGTEADDTDNIIAAYAMGYTAAQIGSAYGVTHGPITRRLRLAGVPVLSDQESKMRRTQRRMRSAQLFWREAAALQPGDWVPLRCGGPSVTSGLSPLPPTPPRDYSAPVARLPLLREPDVMDEDLAWLTGLLIGDGYIYGRPDKKRRGQINYRVGWITKTDESVVRVRAILSDKFGLVAGEQIKNKITTLTVQRQALFEFFASRVGLDQNDKLKTPAAIFNSPQAVVRAFLDGLYTADGAKTPIGNPRKDGSPIYLRRYYTKSKRLAEEYALLSLWLGDQPRIVTRIDSYVYPNQRRPEHMPFYAVHIIERRRVPVDLCFNATHAEQGMPGFAVYEAGRCMYEETLRRWIPDHPLLQEGVIYDQVVAVDDAGMQDVFDVSVPEQHSFAANGLIAHNCMLGLAGETEETAQELEDWLVARARDGLRDADVTVYTPYPGTPMWDAFEKSDSYVAPGGKHGLRLVHQMNFAGETTHYKGLRGHYVSRVETFDPVTGKTLMTAEQIVAARDRVEANFRAEVARVSGTSGAKIDG